MAFTAELDQASYVVGEEMVLTITFDTEEDRSYPAQAVVNVTGLPPITLAATVGREITVTDEDREWTQTEDTGLVVTYTAVA